TFRSPPPVARMMRSASDWFRMSARATHRARFAHDGSPVGLRLTLSRTKHTRTVDRRAPLLPTAHQAVEYLLGLMLAYLAIRRSGSSALALLVIAVIAATV